MLNTKYELLQWAKRFAPLKMIKEQNFTDGVCFSMILKAIHPQIPLLDPQVMMDYKIKNLEALKIVMKQYKVNIDFDINKIARRDQDAAFKLMQDLKIYYTLQKEKQAKQQDAGEPRQQPEKRSTLIPFTSQFGSKKLEPVQGLPITYTPSSQSQQIQSQPVMHCAMASPILAELIQDANQKLFRLPSRSRSPSPSISPAEKIYTPKIVNRTQEVINQQQHFNKKFEEENQEQESSRHTYAASHIQNNQQTYPENLRQSPKWSPHGTKERSRATIENQPPLPQYSFTTPMQKSFKQSFMQYSESCSNYSNRQSQIPQPQMNQFSLPSQPQSQIYTLNTNQSTPNFGVVEIDQQSKELIDEYNKIQTSNNKQVQKDSIRKILRRIIMDGKGLHTAQLQIQIIDAISGPEDRDLLEYKYWLQGQLQSQIPQGQLITQDQATQYHSIDSQGFYAQNSQLIPRSQEEVMPQINQFQFQPQQMAPYDQMQGQMMAQQQILVQEQMIPQLQMIPQEQQMIPIEQRNYSQSITLPTNASSQSQNLIQSQNQILSQNHLIFSQSTLPNSQQQNQIYSQNNQLGQVGSQRSYEGQNY